MLTFCSLRPLSTFLERNVATASQSVCAHDCYYMAASDIDTLCWNVRGLNSAKRCLAVHEMIASTSCHIACLQETKLQSLDGTLARFLGAYRLNQFTYKLAHGTKGGILVLWNDNALDLQNIQIGRYSITATLTMRYSAASFVLTTIYGPSRRVKKKTSCNISDKSNLRLAPNG